jgi:chemotaxis family two-component system response regulator Rcp1
MTKQNQKRINVLMIEDNTMDAILTLETLSESERNSYEISTVKDGLEALAFLGRIDGYEKAPRPDIIILDLNLPKMDGFDFLMEIKGKENFRTVPVVILTTSEVKEDIERAKRLKADSYLLKPLDLDRFEEILSGIQEQRTRN